MHAAIGQRVARRHLISRRVPRHAAGIAQATARGALIHAHRQRSPCGAVETLPLVTNTVPTRVLGAIRVVPTFHDGAHRSAEAIRQAALPRGAILIARAHGIAAILIVRATRNGFVDPAAGLTFRAAAPLAIALVHAQGRRRHEALRTCAGRRSLEQAAGLDRVAQHEAVGGTGTAVARLGSNPLARASRAPTRSASRGVTRSAGIGAAAATARAPGRARSPTSTDEQRHRPTRQPVAHFGHLQV